MGNYKLSSRAQWDVVGIYKYGIKNFGAQQALAYLNHLEDFLKELADRPELFRDASPIAKGLKFYAFNAHVIYFLFDQAGEINVIRILGKRMNFDEHF